MASAEKKAYRAAQSYLGWDDEEVASFFGYRSLDSFRRSSAYNKRRRWFAELVGQVRAKAEKECEARLKEERTKVDKFFSGLKDFAKTK